MKMLLKGALLTSLGLAALTSAQAQYASTDLVLGFTGGTSGNDVLFDIGTPSQIGVGGSTTVDLSSSINFSLWNAGGYTSFGVVGFSSTLGNRGIYSTAPQGSTPNSVPNHSAYNGISLDIQSTGQMIDGTGTPANSAIVSTTNPDSWSQNMANPGANTFYNNYGNPDALLSGNSGVADLYFAKEDNSAPQLLGTFTMSGNDLNFTPAVVPEPSTLALFGAAGVLGLAFRRYFGRNS